MTSSRRQKYAFLGLLFVPMFLSGCGKEDGKAVRASTYTGAIPITPGAFTSEFLECETGSRAYRMPRDSQIVRKMIIVEDRIYMTDVNHFRIVDGSSRYEFSGTVTRTYDLAGVTYVRNDGNPPTFELSLTAGQHSGSTISGIGNYTLRDSDFVPLTLALKNSGALNLRIREGGEPSRLHVYQTASAGICEPGDTLHLVFKRSKF